VLIKHDKEPVDEGRTYGIGANYPNRLKVVRGTVVILWGVKKRERMFYGYGIVSTVSPSDFGETRGRRRVFGLELRFARGSYVKFKPEKPFTKTVWQMIRSLPNYADQMPIRIINQRIFEEILGHTWSSEHKKTISEGEVRAAIKSGNWELIREVMTSETTSAATKRNGQAAIRREILKRYNYQCALCDVTEPELLVASHVVPWSVDEASRGVLNNVICLCVMHDRLFEKGFITLTNNNSVVFSRRFDANAKMSKMFASVRATTYSRLSVKTAIGPRKSSLDYHRHKVFR
jgi:hypothetical protein